MLHIVNHTLYDHDRLERLLARTSDGDAVLLIQLAATAAKSGAAAAFGLHQAVTKGLTLYVLGEDLAAHGIGSDEVMNAITVVDYAGFVELTTQHPTIHSWF